MHNKYYVFIGIACIALLNLSTNSIIFATKNISIKKSDLPRCFNIQTHQLPRFFTGENIIQLYTYFNISDKRIPVKDEFESTEKYNARLLEFKKNNSFINNIFAIRIKHKSNYDADNKVLNICIEPIDRIAFSKQLLSRYVGSNAFNVKRIVEKYNISEYGIFIPNNYQYKDSDSLSIKTTEKILPNAIYNPNKKTTEGLLESTDKMIDELIAKIDLSKIKEFNKDIRIQITNPIEAKYLKLRIGTLLIFKPIGTGSLVSYTKTYQEATIDAPEEWICNKYIINIHPLALWVYDMSNGRVIKKIEYNNI